MAILDLLKLLPEINFKVLMMLISHLHFVSTHKGKNKMETGNLAIVFGPILLRPRELDPTTILSDVVHVNSVLMTLIQFEDFFFEEGDHEDKLHIDFVDEGSDKKARKAGVLDDWKERNKIRAQKRKEKKQQRLKEKEEKISKLQQQKEDLKKKEQARELEMLAKMERRRNLRENLMKERRHRMVKSSDLFRTAEDLKGKYEGKKGDSVIRRAVKINPETKEVTDPKDAILYQKLQRTASRIRKGKYTSQELTQWLEELAAGN